MLKILFSIHVNNIAYMCIKYLPINYNAYSINNNNSRAMLIINEILFCMYAPL